ncbi:MAG: hypothetical protein ABW061_02765 [Polyangiaceae bacterium]
MDKKAHRNMLTVARVGAVLVDLESGLTIGAYSPRPRIERRELEDDANLSDLPCVVPNPKTKAGRNK